MKAALAAFALLAALVPAHAYELPNPDAFVEGYADCEAATSNDEDCAEIAQLLTEAREQGWCWRDEWVRCE